MKTPNTHPKKTKISKQTKNAGRVAQVAERLRSKCEAPSSNPSNIKKKKKKAKKTFYKINQI
jgi:hypothetical protein